MIWSLALLSHGLFLGCVGPGGGPGTYPRDGDRDVPVDTELVYDFGRKGLRAEDFVIENDHTGRYVQGEWEIDNGEARFLPVGGWDYETRYRLKVSNKSLIFVTEAHVPEVNEWVQRVGPDRFDSAADREVVLDLGSVSEDETLFVVPLNASQAEVGVTFSLSLSSSTSDALSFREAKANDQSIQATISPQDRFRRLHLRHRQKVEAFLTTPPQQEMISEPVHAACDETVVGQSVCDFYVLSASTDGYEEIQARLVFQDEQANWYVDQDDLWDFSDPTEIEFLARTLREAAIPTVAAYFGDVPDVDQNQRINVVMSHHLVDPKAGAGYWGYVAPWDYFENELLEEARSNEGDFFYLATPSSMEGLGFSREYYFDWMRGTIVHELKHLVASFVRLDAGHLLENLSLEEPSAVAAEQLAGVGSQIGRPQSRAVNGLTSPQDYRVFHSAGVPSDRDDRLSLYGFSFLFLWGVAEEVGHQNFWRQWTLGPEQGVENVELHGGGSFQQLVQNWALKLILDDTGYDSNYELDGVDLKDGTWADLGSTEVELNTRYSDTVSSFAVYRYQGNANSLMLRIQSYHKAPYFMVIRLPGDWP